MDHGSTATELDHHIIVVGAGIIGASTAYHLAKNGVACLVLEQCDVACAASGKAGGFLAEDWCDETAVRSLARASFPMHAALEKELDVSLGYRQLEAYSVSLVHRSSSTAAYQSRTRAKSSLNWIQDGDIALKNRPRLIGSKATIAQIHPRRLTVALLDAAKRLAGSQLRICKVVGVKCITADLVHVSVQDRDGDEPHVLRAAKVVLAMGPWSVRAQSWFPQLPAIMARKSLSIVIRGTLPPHALFTEYVDGSGRASEPEVYPREDETYICHSARQEDLPDDPSAIIADAVDVRVLKEFASAISPSLKSAVADEDAVVAQACNLPLSPDGVPLIGKVPGLQNVFIGAGHSCWGILNSPATGKALAELIIHGKATCVDLRPFCPSRFCERA